MTQKDIRDAYVRIRQIDHTIPDEVLDFMRDCALAKLQEQNKDEHKPKQSEGWDFYDRFCR